MPFQSCSADKPLASLFPYWLSLVFAPASVSAFFTVHRTTARDMSVNVVERDLNHTLVMRYGPRLVPLSPDGRDEEQGEREENILLQEVETVEPRLNSSGTVVDNWRSSRRDFFLSQRLSYSHCKPCKIDVMLRIFWETRPRACGRVKE